MLEDLGKKGCPNYGGMADYIPRPGFSRAARATWAASVYRWPLPRFPAPVQCESGVVAGPEAVCTVFSCETPHDAALSLHLASGSLRPGCPNGHWGVRGRHPNGSTRYHCLGPEDLTPYFHSDDSFLCTGECVARYHWPDPPL